MTPGSKPILQVNSTTVGTMFMGIEIIVFRIPELEVIGFNPFHIPRSGFCSVSITLSKVYS
jgi:hypothetical protein